MIKMLLKNFKALVQPKEFVNLAYRKAGTMVGYTFLSTLLILVLCTVVPTQIKFSVERLTIPAMVDEIVPEFEVKNGELTIANDEHFSSLVEQSTQNDGFIWYDTSVDQVSANENSMDYLGYYLTEEEIMQTQDCANMFFLSKKNMLVYDSGQWTEVKWSDITDAFQMNSFSRDTLKNMLPSWIQIFLIIAYVGIYIGNMFGIFIMALVWGFAGLIVNAIVKGKYSFEHLYCTSVYIQIAVMAIRQLLKNLTLLSDDTATSIGRALICAYVIFAIVHKVKKDGPYKNPLLDYRFTPDGPVVGTFDPSFNGNADYSQPVAGGYNPNPAYSANQGQTRGVYETPVYKPNAAMQQGKNSGYNPNPAYSENGGTGQYENNVYQPNSRMYSREELNAMQQKPAEKEENNRPEFAQDPQFAAQNMVWKPQTPENTGMMEEPTFTSQEWKPQAQFDYKGEKEKWNETAQRWNANNKKSFSQEWKPQQPASKEDELFLNSQNGWKKEQQVWNGSAKPDQSNPTAGKGNNTGEQKQWGQAPVWGKKDDGLE